MAKIKESLTGHTLTILIVIIGFLVNIAVMLGKIPLLEIYGPKLLLVFLLVIVVVFITEMYRSSVWKYALKIQKIQKILNRFENEHTGKPFSQDVDLSIVELICLSEKVKKLSFQVSDFRLLDDQRIELVVNKGAKDGLTSDMKLGIYDIHLGDKLCEVKLKMAGMGALRDHPITEPLGKIQSSSTIINIPFDSKWNLSTHNLSKDTFEFRLIIPRPESNLNALLSDIKHVLDE